MGSITQEHIDNLIKESKIEVIEAGQKTVILHVTLPNGFELVEAGACVDPADYDVEIGRAVALEKIKGKLWELEGYKLQWALRGVGLDDATLVWAANWVRDHITDDPADKANETLKMVADSLLAARLNYTMTARPTGRGKYKRG